MRLPLVLFSLLTVGPFARAEVKLPAIFADHMVLQRGIPAPVWGTATPGEAVAIGFAGQQVKAVAGADGKWMARLQPLEASDQGRDLTVNGATIHDVLVGDVWLASGQSNMGFGLSSAHNAAEAIAASADNGLRFFSLQHRTAPEVRTDIAGRWDIASPQTAGGFSAVAYFFAKEIRQDQKVPVAVLHGSWGGTPIQIWMSMAAFKKEPPITASLDLWEKAVSDYKKSQADPGLEAQYKKDLKQWQTEVAPVYNAAVKQWTADKEAGKAVGPKPAPSRPEPMNPDPMDIPSPSRRPHTPSVAYNGMIAPLAPYAIKGALWYQGEENSGHGIEYRELLPRLIGDWRSLWAQGDFPFLIVQLPCNGPDTKPVADAGEPYLREAQLMALKVPATGLAITIDVGDPANVHPGDKLDVGKRLALAARKVAYGEQVEGSGPIYDSASVEGRAMRIHFRETGSGLTIGQAPWVAPKNQLVPKDKLHGFYIAGTDRKWYEADARIEGENVVVSSAEAPQPVAVRYGWANSPKCNLYNAEGLPASPFRTDGW